MVMEVETLTSIETSDRAGRPSPAGHLTARRTPRIALVLGGGAARGFSHIGVIRALQSHGIRPDVVVGTSIGAVVGGAFVAGHLDGFESWARGLRARSVFGYLDIQLNGSGLIGGRKLAAKLRDAFGPTRIEDLSTPFAVVATEIRTGHEVWLTRGRMVDAICASYALPGIFTPVLIGERWLVDGALVNPVPVSAARALGAEIVIAVSLNSDNFGHGGTIAAFGTPPEPPEIDAQPVKLPSGLRRFFTAERALRRGFFGGEVLGSQRLGGRDTPAISTVMVEAFNIMQDRITRARLAGDPPDILISPRGAGIGLFDFHRAAEAIDQGRRATERAIESIEEAIALLAPQVRAPTPAPAANDLGPDLSAQAAQ
jgi:NTE family protein